MPYSRVGGCKAEAIIIIEKNRFASQISNNSFYHRPSVKLLTKKEKKIVLSDIMPF